MKMTPAQWEQIRAHFDAAVVLGRDEREAYLARACPDPELRRQVSLMLAADDSDDDDLGQIVQGAASESFQTSIAPGLALGPYRIVREIGRGGMGSVYLAERADDVYVQKVAIKVVNIALAGAQSLARFRSERQILAQLEHPNIARLIDGGTTGDGAPYLVMEYVDGVPIDQYCDDNNLTVVERLGLFADVCAAVNVAHQNLIVHRDIKPANILVTAKGVPKLLDFGIAKLLEPQSTAATLAVTQADMRLFTPDYASPEQVQGQPITTASDIYSLGVLLYRLMVGVSPYAIAGEPREALLGAICNQAPERPSTRILTVAADTKIESIRHRKTTTTRLRRRLRGDLDNIVLMALRKEPERRYESARRLAADIDNYLANRPVTARRDTLGYRARKYLRRNRAAVAVTAAALVAIVGMTTFYTLELAAERDRARRAAAEATQTADFLQNLFRVSDPNETGGADVTARALLDQGARQLDVTLRQQPGVRAALQNTIGKVYASLGLRDDARALLEQALAAMEAQSPQPAESIADVLHALSEVASTQEDYENARRYAERAIAMARTRSLDADYLTRGQLALGSALYAEGRFEEAHEIVESARNAMDDAGQTDTTLYAEALTALAQGYEIEADYERATELLREAVGLYDARLGTLHGDTIFARRTLAFLLDRQRLFDEAEILLRDALEASLTLYGDAHPDVALVQGELGTLYRHRGEPETAMEFLLAGLETSKKAYGDDHSFVAYDMVAVANLGYRTRGMAFSEPLFREALEIYDRALPEDHPYKATLMVSFAHRLIGENRVSEARPMLVRGKAISEATLPPDHWLIAQFDILTGMAERRDGNERAATELLRDGFERLRAGRGVNHGATQRALRELVANLEAVGESEDRDHYAAFLEDSAEPIR